MKGDIFYTLLIRGVNYPQPMHQRAVGFLVSVV